MQISFFIHTCPVSLSNLYNLKPGLLGPSLFRLGVIEGASIAQDMGRPEKKIIFIAINF